MLSGIWVTESKFAAAASKLPESHFLSAWRIKNVSGVDHGVIQLRDCKGY